jgi:signal transduction histidine kinase
MTAALALGGWTAALCALAAAAFLRAALVRRMALVAQAAHELRGPLGAALLGLHGVGSGPGGSRRVAAVQLELRRAGLALEDLHAAPRGRRAPEIAEHVDVGALVTEAAEAWRPLAAALGTELHVAPVLGRPVVRADRLRLAQAVGNLVLNAFEHGAGPVRIRVEAARASVRVAVRDHGPGLPAPPAGGPHAGRRGHGLAIAARVAERHGGRLFCAPVTAGACLVLELPRAGAAPRAGGLRALAGRTLRRGPAGRRSAAGRRGRGARRSWALFPAWWAGRWPALLRARRPYGAAFPGRR